MRVLRIRPLLCPTVPEDLPHPGDNPVAPVAPGRVSHRQPNALESGSLRVDNRILMNRSSVAEGRAVPKWNIASLISPQTSPGIRIMEVSRIIRNPAVPDPAVAIGPGRLVG